MKQYPMITALMVTTGRIPLVKQSYKYFKKQDYPNKHLLIVNDGDVKEHEALKKIMGEDREVSVLHSARKRKLGELRNLALEYSPSDLTIQWDDDDWYGPTRISEQYKGHHDGEYPAVVLKEQLHYFCDTNEVAWVSDPNGIEGTLFLDRRAGKFYPPASKGEDTVLKKELKLQNMLHIVEGGTCYCRTFHGSNTWDRDHHIERIRVMGKKRIDMEALKKAARIYRWPKGWKPLFG